MNRSFYLLLTLFLCSLMTLQAHATAYIRGANAPWNQTTNEAAMDAAFGAGNWDDLRMAGGVAPFLPGSGHAFIFLEGSDGTAIELNTFLTTHRTEIEAFVQAGGALLLNSAPNQGGDIDFGFGGVTLSANKLTDEVVAVVRRHPIFAGIATDYIGGSFGHGIVGAGVTPIIVGAPGADYPGEVVLGELSFGDGFVLLGGMTTDNFHNPKPDAATLRTNIITYTAAKKEYKYQPVQSVPTMSLYTIIATTLGLILVVMRRSLVLAKRT